MMGHVQQGEILFANDVYDHKSSEYMDSQSTTSSEDDHSLDSAQMADIVIDEHQEGRLASSSFASSSSPSPSPTLTITPWMITTYNLLIEYFPYRHIMAQIFSYCHIDIHMFPDITFPDTTELQSKYNYYD